MSGRKKIGFLGPSGSFSEQALFAYFGSDVISVECKYFEDIFILLKNNAIDFGILPIENTSTGGIIEVYDLLRKNDCYIIGEQSIKVEHHLLGIHGTSADKIRKVYSHPQPYQQSKDFFISRPLIEFIPTASTADSAKFVSLQNDCTIASIGSRRAAEIYNLSILSENINFNCENFTRFAVISKDQLINSDADKISIIYTLPNKPGSLYKSLGFFANNEINMIKIESRPIVGHPWEYFFYIDIEGNLNDSNVQKALSELRNLGTYYKMLGNYKSDKSFNMAGEDNAK